MADHLDRLKQVISVASFHELRQDDVLALRACVEEIERLRGVEEVDRRMCEAQLDMRDEINALRHTVAAKDEEIGQIRTALREAGLEITVVSSDFGITVN